MKKKYNIAFILLFMIFMFSCTSEHIPTLPIIEYDCEASKLLITQTDTAAHDTAYIEINSFYQKTFPIKDSISLSFDTIVKQFDQIEFAYRLAIQNCTETIIVHTSRTNDTLFYYNYPNVDIEPITVAEVISGDCIGMYDVNFKRNYRDKIRLWIFNNHIHPDSMLIEDMNSLMKQFNYSGHNEYSKRSGNPPILRNLNGTRYKFDVSLPGKFFYLFAAQNGGSVKSFIERKISEGLKDAHLTTTDEFVCEQTGETGPNCLFLIGIDENWSYRIIPLGVVFVDNSAPTINARGHRPNNSIYSLRYSQPVFPNLGSWPSKIYLPSQDVLVKLPDPPVSITSSVSISYGSFEGNDYFGYDIPFYVEKSGDVRTITIGNHTLEASRIKDGECIRLHMKKLHIGDNSIPLTATDARGNQSTSSLSIPIVHVRNNSYDDDDYDDLESRINDLEDRLDDLE